MSDLPTFRHLLKAVNEDSVDEDTTAFSYKVIEFRKDGTFIFRPNIKIEGTKMRADGVKIYEVQEGDRFKLLTQGQYLMHKVLWDNIRSSKNWPKLNDKGDPE